MFSLPDIAIGAVIAAVITGVLSLLGLIISKEQKVSEFRQEWICQLRQQVAALITHSIAIHGSLESSKEKTDQERWLLIKDDLNAINIASCNIILLLNEKEPAARKILSSVEDIENSFIPPSFPTWQEQKLRHDKLFMHTRIVLKTEWNRVRHGELTFKIAKYSAAVLVILSVTVISSIAIKIIHV